jgi:hypothetical protein
MNNKITAGEGLRMVRAFLAIRNPEARRKIVDAAESAVRNDAKAD